MEKIVGIDLADDGEDTVDPVAIEAALRHMSESARRQAFAAGLSVLVVRSGRLVKLHPDGREVDLGPLIPTPVTMPQ